MLEALGHPLFLFVCGDQPWQVEQARRMKWFDFMVVFEHKMKMHNE